MKTNMNTTKEALRNEKRAYLDMAAEVDRRRCAYFQKKAALHNAENEVIEDMYRTVQTLIAANGKFPTAAQITRAMGGRMSRHEVVGQLTVALGEHYNGCGRTRNATHEPTARRLNGAVQAHYDRRLMTFAEVDQQGRMVDGGATITIEKHVKTYEVREG